MFNQRTGGSAGTTVIAEGVRVDGNFAGESDMVIDGMVQGTITTGQSVTIGKTADIQANIKAGSVTVGGSVKGNIQAKDRLELMSGSHVDGDVSAKVLVIAEGAVLNGKCTMGGHEVIKPITSMKETAASSTTKRQPVAAS